MISMQKQMVNMLEQMLKMQEVAEAREECNNNMWFSMHQEQQEMRKAFQRHSESTHLMFTHLSEATGIEQPPVQATLAFSASPANLTVMPAPHLGTSGIHRDQSTEALNETADQDKETTAEPVQQD